ncbi:hypothetical protein D9619_010284 [Psilocybe cf. subviscida]|uniref:NACHT domain-containing protein n=1 Tax=Psilocybe cf. subviscida TaxID=2480587 RepID=A0A8H5AS70_9AGAR|nr:hypothetical protein D9619_010284 [Psilocybe cf. subviscida]
MPSDNIYLASSASRNCDLDTLTLSRHRHPNRGSITSIDIFQNATNCRIKNSSFVLNNIQAPGDPLNKLYDQVATNAILNAGGRADQVKCYPGTREEVIGLIERWMDSDAKDNTIPNMMWLSGPAGAGKSAIVQTIAERCKERNVLAANFFFFRADPTRSAAQALVATLLYQIVKASPVARQAIETVLSEDPLLFGASIQDQFNLLRLSGSPPLHHIPPSLESPARRPIVLLIDGLDECDSERKLSQRQIIQALEHLLMQNDSPFLVLVASRAEPQLCMAFKQLGFPIKSIFLDDQYAPERDIRTFVTGEFKKIKKSHDLAHTLGDSWPSVNNVEAIVRKSSGQFIFAATVMRFLSNSSASPMLSLEIVLGIVPIGKNSPFSQLDAVYTYILSQADNQEVVKDLLSAQLLHNTFNRDNRVLQPIILPIKTILSTYNPARYGRALITNSCASELTAILQFQGNQLKFYHASFTDFLENKSRSGEYHIDIGAFGAKILPALWMKAPESMSSALTALELFITLKKPTPEITKAFLTISPASTKNPNLILKYNSNNAIRIFKSIYRLYYHDDVKTYKKILHQWASWYVSARDLTDLPHLPG